MLRISPICFLACLLTPALATAEDRNTAPAPVDVFTRTQEGYHTYRIPALAVTTDGTLVTIVEGRRDKAHDPGQGHIDLVYKTSRDGGRTWSSLAVLHRPPEGWGASNPTTVVQRDTGRLFVFFNVWMAGRGSRNSQADQRHNQVWVRHSDDHGRNWSPPRDITEMARDVENWNTVVLGPGTGADAGDGRLAIPAYAHAAGEGDDQDVRSFAIVSDDGGQTFSRGERIAVPSGECQIISIGGNRLLMDARQRAGKHRWIAVSDDHGRTWSEPRPGPQAVPVNTSIAEYRPAEADKAWLLWTGPRGPGRSNLALRISQDEGRTLGHERLIAAGRAAYSSMAVLADGAVGVVWERGQAESVPGGTVPESIRFVCLDPDWLEEARRSGS
jgi:sialidase-1